MSDIFTGQDQGYDPYALDPDTAQLIMMLAQTGYQPYPQMSNVPYVKDLMGGSTDPLRQVKSQQSNLKSAKSLMGYDPIAGFAGPEFDPYVPQYDQVANEAQGDQYAEALLNDMQNGVGALSLQNQIDEATYNEKDGPSEGKVLSPQQAKNYKSWLSRAQKAYTTDSLEYQKRDQMATQGDPNAVVPTDSANNFNEDDYIKQLAVKGQLGPQRQAVQKSSPGLVNLPTPRGTGPRSVGPVGRAEAAGYQDRERGYRGRAQQAVQNSVQPSAARERAVRAIQAYRLAMGMSPN